MLQKYKEFLFRRFKAGFNNIEWTKSVWIDAKTLNKLELYFNGPASLQRGFVLNTWPCYC